MISFRWYSAFVRSTGGRELFRPRRICLAQGRSIPQDPEQVSVRVHLVLFRRFNRTALHLFYCCPLSLAEKPQCAHLKNGHFQMGVWKIRWSPHPGHFISIVGNSRNIRNAMTTTRGLFSCFMLHSIKKTLSNITCKMIVLQTFTLNVICAVLELYFSAETILIFDFDLAEKPHLGHLYQNRPSPIIGILFLHTGHFESVNIPTRTPATRNVHAKSKTAIS